MKKIVAINSCNYGSTGNIMLSILQTAETEGMDTLACYPKARRTIPNFKLNKHYFIGGLILRNIGLRLSAITGLYGCFSAFDTVKLINKLKRFDPDVIHFHNLHDSYINIPLIFHYIKKRRIKVIWTLHDCWSFTGHCPHFVIEKCEKWKQGCNHCPLYRQYPSSIIDNSRIMWKLKKRWFTGVGDMTIVTPSHWLADLANQSFLNENPIQVINNGINLRIFTPRKSDFRIKYGLNNKFIILGVAMGWDTKKGVDVFIELANRLDDRFKIVLVGTNDKVDLQLPDSIISIHRTNNQIELAEIYTAADLFVNPTREENYPTVNMESIACGTPVLTFRTGGSPEILDNKTGHIVDVDDIDAMEQQILRIFSQNPFSEKDCLDKAKTFDKDKKFQEYVELYK